MGILFLNSLSRYVSTKYPRKTLFGLENKTVYFYTKADLILYINLSGCYLLNSFLFNQDYIEIIF